MQIAPNGRIDENSRQHQLYMRRAGKRRQQRGITGPVFQQFDAEGYARQNSREEDFQNSVLGGSQQDSVLAYKKGPKLKASWQHSLPSSSSSSRSQSFYQGGGAQSSRGQHSAVERTESHQSAFSSGYEASSSRRQRTSSSTSNSDSESYPMQASSVHLSSEVTEERGRKSESPSRKRRRMSQSVVDHASTSSHQLVRPWQNTSNQEPINNMAAAATQRPTPPELCSGTSRRPVGRSASIRRHSQRQRERQIRNWTHSVSSGHSSGPSNAPDRRAFQQPSSTLGQQGPVTAGPSSAVPFHPHLIIDLNNEAAVPSSVPFSLPVSVPTYAVPICTGHTTIPPCNTHHNPFNPSLHLGVGAHPANHTNPIPVCGVSHVPLCGMHIPACSVQHVAMRQQSLPVFQHESHSLLGHIHPQVPPQVPPQHHHHQQQQQHPSYLSAAPSTHQTRNHEMDFLHERVTPAFHVPSATHPTPLFNSAPLHVVQDPYFRTAPREIAHMPQAYHRFNAFTRQRQPTIPQWRTPIAPPTTALQPPYSGWLLRYILPTPPVTSGLQMELDSAPVEENYEALLNLAERLGEAKPRGLTKSVIDQLPSYRYNPDTHQSINDQTCCVVCMSDFEIKQLLRVLPCSHEFHARCVDKWLKSNRTCPICRADASEFNNQS
ncbi:E3 ubiquitin-protein ligase RNF38 [Holothuria leucospilota]|uniref:E3 ubiquitin-protein ligase RNF38 n=1 Tax=Holothuria leucospilota TaxID=206669 RepID=A0A9Q1BHZ8_HOLLE|nr:E3 ubiquitin-protein ligase RNF38 [Holothuria leucospilota]